MSWLQALVLGAVQGITEFLPVSSSGHLVLVEKLWQIKTDSLLFITVLHIGTLLAVVWAFRKELRWLTRHPSSWTARMLVLACVPTALVGVLLEDLFERAFASAATLGVEFVITGVVLWWMDSVAAGRGSEEDLTAKDALWIGLFQSAAILPALSRSGLTIAGGLWRGLNREAAGRFSFLLSIPAILGATLLELEKVLDGPRQVGVPWPELVIGAAAAALFGYLSVHGTLWLIRRAKMRYFAIYTWLLAASILCDQLWFHVWFVPLTR